jgi:hypothetical protein
MTLSAGLFTACRKDKDPLIIVPASSGSSLQLSGIAGSEAGSSAGNTVFVDLSTDKQTAVARNSWDLGFYCGADFRVIINNTTSAMARALPTRTSLSDVVASDTAGLSLAFSFSAADYAKIDDVRGDLSKTVIAAVSATDADNKVYVLNCGTGGSVPTRDWYKIRVTRNSASGYTLQYAKLAAGSAINTIGIAKDADFNFKYVHLANGAVEVEPAKKLWDFKWSYLVYETPYGSGNIPYAFSDFVILNQYAGVQAAEVMNSTITYDNYAAANISTTTFSSAPDVIGGNWRSTQPATGARTDRFYVVKDPSGNVYKIKFQAMGAGDGGVRGRPQFEYKLVR